MPPPLQPIDKVSASHISQAQQYSYRENDPSRKPTPIAIPANPPPPTSYRIPSSRPIPRDDGEGENFRIDVPEVHEVQQSADDALKDMRELLTGALGGLKLEDVDLSEAVVDGFSDGITLMPHQIQGRAWMRERESGKKRGGILADVRTFYPSSIKRPKSYPIDP